MEGTTRVVADAAAEIATMTEVKTTVATTAETERRSI